MKHTGGLLVAVVCLALRGPIAMADEKIILSPINDATSGTVLSGYVDTSLHWQAVGPPASRVIHSRGKSQYARYRSKKSGITGSARFYFGLPPYIDPGPVSVQANIRCFTLSGIYLTEVRTDAAGNFKIGLKPGEYRLSADPLFRRAPMNVGVADHQYLSVELQYGRPPGPLIPGELPNFF